MNSSVVSQNNHQRFFFLSLVFTLLMLAASGFFIKGMLSGEADGVSLSTKSCLSVMRTNGFNPNQQGNELSVILATTTNIESLVYKSGVIIASCPAYTLKDYCAGAGCPKPGVSFTLQQKEL